MATHRIEGFLPVSPIYSHLLNNHLSGSPFSPPQTDKKLSSDDSSVAILSHHDALSNQDPLDPSSPAATLHFHEKFTADNSEHRGIHPLLALRSHRENLAPLITRALHALPLAPSASTTDPATTIPIRTSDGTWVVKRKPDFISVTRGPGMRGSLSTGIDTAKGLSLAWQVPLLGVHHMHAHALTPRLVSALETRAESRAGPKPEFPFLSLLVSGGNTLLVHSKALTEHTVLVERCDVSIGDAIDKMARNICAESLQQLPPEIMYGHLLESFAFPNGVADHKYTAPATRGEQIGRRTTRWGWSLPVPFGQTRAGEKSRVMQFTFAGLGTAVEKICTGPKEMSREERVELAREGMRIAFEHLASRVEWALDSLREQGEQISTLVVSGGVASNKYLKTM